MAKFKRGDIVMIDGKLRATVEDEVAVRVGSHVAVYGMGALYNLNVAKGAHVMAFESQLKAPMTEVEETAHMLVQGIETVIKQTIVFRHQKDLYVCEYCYARADSEGVIHKEGCIVQMLLNLTAPEKLKGLRR